jgi:mono/diheme cytochrome c family protein
MNRLVLTAAARRILGYLVAALGVLLLLASAAWWYGESQWNRFENLTPAQAFADGDFGLQLAPLKYLLVAQTVSKASLGDNWVKHFGFLRRRDAADGMCERDAPKNLPVGFSVSNRLQGNVAPVPVKFVGLTCAACHSAAVGKAGVVIGAGTQTADVIAFSDAYFNAILDPALSVDAILAQYEKQCPGQEGALQRLADKFFIGQWLSGLRTQLLTNATMYDMPYHGAELAVPADIPTGPSRTRPFRSVVRNTLDFPGVGNVAYSKVPLAATQGLKKWSQYDGSIGDANVRSLIAVFTSSATLPAINEPQIADNVRKASQFTIDLGVTLPLPSLAQAFPDHAAPPPAQVERGRAVYLAQCAGCHGHPEPGGWKMPPGKADPPITPIEILGTDPGRLNFRYADMMVVGLATTFPNADPEPQRRAIAGKLAEADKEGDLATAGWWRQTAQRFELAAREFPAGHRFAFAQDNLARRYGYENSPIPFAWLRAPYLHNGSIPTMRELIGLDERPAQFCRGTAGYDPAAMGIVAPKPDATGCHGDTYFLFDTAQPGNSNRGHEFPKPGSVSRDDLEALLAFVGTL